MTRDAPTSIRFSSDVAARLSSWAAGHGGTSLSSAVNLLVDEALRSEEHPNIVFRHGPTGRRAGLIGGPDVWEIIRSVRAARQAEPDRSEDGIIAAVAANAALPEHLVRAAVRYWSAYPDAIDSEIAANEQAERDTEAAWRRERGLLGRR